MVQRHYYNNVRMLIVSVIHSLVRAGFCRGYFKPKLVL